MKAKKSEKADLENKRNTFLLFGLVAALGIVLVAFEWNTKATGATDFGPMAAVNVEEEIIPITRMDEIKPPPPPPPPVQVEVITIVDDDVVIDEEFEMESTEVTEDLTIDIAPILETTSEEEIEEDKVFVIVEEQPEFPGGERALLRFINNSIRYPVIAQENGVQGRVFYKFVVDTDGSVTNVEIIRGPDASLNKEAKRVLESLPKFKPGKQRGRPVRVYFSSAINFVLQ